MPDNVDPNAPPTVEELQKELAEAKATTTASEGRYKSLQRTHEKARQESGDMRGVKSYVAAIADAIQNNEMFADQAPAFAKAAQEQRYTDALSQAQDETLGEMHDMMADAGMETDDAVFAPALVALEAGKLREARQIVRSVTRTAGRPDIDAIVTAKLEAAKQAVLKVDHGAEKATPGEKPTTIEEFRAMSPDDRMAAMKKNPNILRS